MKYFLQRIQSYLTSPTQAQEKISHLLIELRHLGLNFDISQQEENGQKFFYAELVNYPHGYISATGRTMEELEDELKDAIFTAFSVPPLYCIPDLIVFNPALIKTTNICKTVYATT